MDGELDKLIEFCREADKEKSITRQTYLADGSRKENDAEHAWHAALMAVLLSGYANERIDVLKTVTMLLIHDIVEIDAGDTYAYDEDGAKTQSAREKAAADRIFAILPDCEKERMRSLWEEFEEAKTPEARFAHAMDNFQPCMLNAASGGKAWEEHNVCISQILKRNERTADGSRALWEYMRSRLIEPYIQNGKIENK